jgi:N-methylhydantoinase A
MATSSEAELSAPAGTSRPVHGRHGPVATPVRDRDSIGSTEPVTGPAVVEEPYTSIYLPAGWSVVSHASGALVADRLASH